MDNLFTWAATKGYITLYHWTERGIAAYADTVQRAEAAIAGAEKMGGKVHGLYWTMGDHDIVSIGAFPDDETATAFALRLGAQGNVRSTTMRAYGATEMKGILAKAK